MENEVVHDFQGDQVVNVVLNMGVNSGEHDEVANGTRGNDAGNSASGNDAVEANLTQGHPTNHKDGDEYWDKIIASIDDTALNEYSLSGSSSSHDAMHLSSRPVDVDNVLSSLEVVLTSMPRNSNQHCCSQSLQPPVQFPMDT